MELIKLLETRKSVRAFMDKPVAMAEIEKILNAARHTASGTNTQPWKVAVVAGKTKADLDTKLVAAFKAGQAQQMDYNYYPNKLPSAMKLRRIDCGIRMYGALKITRADTEKQHEQWASNYTAFGAPCVLFFFGDRQIEKGSFLDFGMFVQSVMLMATELGLATCTQAALAQYPDIVREQLGYSDENILICGMALGYEDPSAIINQYRTPREEVTAFTKFFD